MRHVDQGEEHFAIHEYYYGIEPAWSETPNAVVGESVEELRKLLEWMLKALDMPVLEYDQPSNESEDAV